MPLALAFLIEYPFYLLPGFTAAREKFLATGRMTAAAARLAVSAVLPWLIYAVGTHHFNIPALLVMASIGVLMSFWFVVFPANPVTDLLYLAAIFGAIILLKVFTPIFPSPMPKLDITILGKVMMVRVLAFSFIEFRGGIDAEYRFVPTAREWLAGLKWFAFLLPVTGAVYWALGLAKFREHPLNIGLVVGTFIGFLWTTDMFEEFIFRGLLQPWLEKWTSNSIVAILITSLLFGSVHLGFHGPFPNWRWAIVAAVPWPLPRICATPDRRHSGRDGGTRTHGRVVEDVLPVNGPGVNTIVGSSVPCSTWLE